MAGQILVSKYLCVFPEIGDRKVAGGDFKELISGVF
jgi:hypothetical protein